MEDKILSSEVKKFLNKLSNKFSNKINKVLEDRDQRKGEIPDFLEETSHIRDSNSWRVDPHPKDISDRRVEITGPPVRKMIINALNSGANVYMSDFEDSNCPTWENCIQGQINLYDAVRGTIEYTNPKNGKSYKLNNKVAALFVRPRGFHLLEKNYLVDGAPIAASLFDYGTFLFNNYEQLLNNGTRPYFYLPKIEHHKEAELWDDIFSFSEKELGMKIGTIKATVLIETLPAVFQMNEILFHLRRHSAGLNCGRWDYIFSFIKTLKEYREYVLPDRKNLGMTQHFMNSYSQLLTQTCHKRGAHAIGGMAAQIPIKNNEVKNTEAMLKVKQDKLREVQGGYDGTWVAHPGLVPLAKEVFDNNMLGQNQIHKQIYLNEEVRKEDLLCVPKGQCTEEGLRDNIRVGFEYLNSWLNGNGCVPINNLMEDAATAEISRMQVWQWHKFNIWLSNGEQITESYLMGVIEDELSHLTNLPKYGETKELFLELFMSENLIDFLTPKCYDALYLSDNI